MFIGFKLNQVGVFLFACCFAHAVLSDQSDMDIYAALPKVSHVAISPSGKKLAMQQVVEGHKHLVVMSITDNSAIASANIEGLNIKNTKFINEDQILLINAVYGPSPLWVGKLEYDDAFIYDLKEKRIDPVFQRGRQSTHGSVVSQFTVDINNYVGVHKKE